MVLCRKCGWKNRYNCHSLPVTWAICLKNSHMIQFIIDYFALSSLSMRAARGDSSICKETAVYEAFS